MTSLWAASQVVRHWLESTGIEGPPTAILQVTNVILKSIAISREKAYEAGYEAARKDFDRCKQH